MNSYVRLSSPKVSNLRESNNSIAFFAHTYGLSVATLCRYFNGEISVDNFKLNVIEALVKNTEMPMGKVVSLLHEYESIKEEKQNVKPAQIINQ